MAKRRGRRDRTQIANDPLSAILTAPTVTHASPLTLIDDRRTWHPQGELRPFKTVQGAVTHVISEVNRNVVRKQRGRTRLLQPKAFSQAKLVFGDRSTQRAAPGVLVCVRRQTRKEVIHALGKGGSRHKRKVRRNTTSNIGCKK